MKTFFLAWQDPESRRWIPVGRLTFDGTLYTFTYTQGAQVSQRFSPFASLTNLYDRYQSEQLFPLFANRMLSKSRPEYKQYMKWLNIDQDDSLEELSRTGGIRATDSLVVFPCPKPEADGRFRLNFFCHGIRHLPPPAQEWVETLEPGRALFLMLDGQNEQDNLAIALRTEPVMVVGYVPRYYGKDFKRILESKVGDSLKVWVEKLNADAPVQLRLLCALTARWPENFSPCSSDEYTSLV